MIKEYELLEEARRRWYVNGAKIKDGVYNTNDTFEIVEPLYVLHKRDSGMIIGGIYGQLPGLIYDPRNNKWAEIIPEEEKKEEVILLVDKHNADKPEISDYELQQIDRHIKKIDQSLHDQIREGGWPFVCRKAGKQYMTLLISGDVPSLQQDEDYMGQKVSAYTMLVALSKVLNEGKEFKSNAYKTSYYYIDYEGGDFLVDYDEDNNSHGIIKFKTRDDAIFALDFAEKEWKILYNSNQ